MSKVSRVPHDPSCLTGIPLSLPALARAYRISTQAAIVGFDWPDVHGVLDKVAEEAQELAQAREPHEIQHEYGDLLFALVNLGRFLDVEPEAALHAANERFIHRFAYVEDGLRQQGRVFEDATLDEMEDLWQRAKAAETR